MAAQATSGSVMDDLMKTCQDLTLPSPGELAEGTVITIWKNKILVDLGGIATGIIAGQEAQDSSGTIAELSEGDNVSAYVLEGENDDGYVILSLRRASQQKTWDKFLQAYETGEAITVTPNEANKGGLLLNIDGIKGFIPVSQLAPLHYPRVDGADSSMILSRLQKLIGVPLLVKILNLDKEGGKLILSERAAEEEERQKSLGKLEVGQKIQGKISGIVNFGIFVTFDGLEGLVHISEIAWGHVKDPNDYGKLGDEIEVLVIGKDDDKISLSTKRLVPDPWIEATKKYKVGTKIEGEINRITPFGAFVKLDDEINGLIHVTEITDKEVSDPAEALKVGQKIKATIIAIDPDDHRVGLSMKTGRSGTGKEVKEKAQKPSPDDGDVAPEEVAGEAAEVTAEVATEEAATTPKKPKKATKAKTAKKAKTSTSKKAPVSPKLTLR